MDLIEYTSRLRDDVTAAATLGDDETKRIAQALASAVERSAQLMLVSALSEFAREASDELGDRTLHVRLDGTAVTVEAARRRPDTGTREPYRTLEDVTGDISRVTLRLVDQIKSRAEEAALQDGVSLNSWVSQAVQEALRDNLRRARPDDRPCERPRERPDEN
ncbi:toxin-antitoxin system HicB family antitoxin [Prescottella subtropica]|uniref:toxin-antitoxin system HicB family antitoxin n=1 Tax=Prescottella subtropica TaxID=2545757 RepID=UPI0010F82B1D|nr:toxin-antitoxin system HicB family antitoxin [Prescottella subtropica]